MTGQQLFEHAIHICGLGAGGSEMPTDVSDLNIRSLDLINTILAENSILDAKIRKSEHKVIAIKDLSDEIICSEIIASLVLPYGLARLFMMGEDDALAADLDKLYQQSRETALRFGRARTHKITEVYG